MGLWRKLWDIVVRGRMLRTIVSLYSHTRSRVMVNGKLSDPVAIKKCVAQGCTILSCTLFDVFVKDLLVELDAAGFGEGVGERIVHSLMFADDFVGLEESPERLEAMMGVVVGWCNRWEIEANVLKFAVVVFNSNEEEETFNWRWGGKTVPARPSYTYLGIESDENCKWERNAVVEKGVKAATKY